MPSGSTGRQSSQDDEANSKSRHKHSDRHGDDKKKSKRDKSTTKEKNDLPVEESSQNETSKEKSIEPSDTSVYDNYVAYAEGKETKKNVEDNEDDNDNDEDAYEIDDSPRCFGVKLTNVSRLLKTAAAFPFVIVVASVKPTGRFAFLRKNFFIRLMNLMIYILPFFITAFVLDVYKDPTVQIVTVFTYMFIYLTPVAFVIFSKIDVLKTSTGIEDGTFCFKPAQHVRFTEANVYQVIGFFFEWIQHVFYVLPVGVVTGKTQARLQDFPPYLPFSVYFY